MAANAGTAEAIAALLHAGAHLEARNVKGLTPLHFGGVRRDCRSRDGTTESGCGLEARAESGLTPLHVAANAGTAEAIAALLHAGAHLEARERKGSHPAAFGGVRRDCRSRDGTTESGCGPEGEEQL